MLIKVGPNCACSMIEIAFNWSHLWDNKCGCSAAFKSSLLLLMLVQVQIHLIGSQAITGYRHLQSPPSMLLLNPGRQGRYQVEF